MPIDPSVKDAIEEDIKAHKIMLYMKGTPDFPQCGFSGQVVQILRTLGVDFHSKNVLEDPALREGIKEFSDWPTIPQLYVDGDFVGGCDIVTEMADSGELQKALGLAT